MVPQITQTKLNINNSTENKIEGDEKKLETKEV